MRYEYYSASEDEPLETTGSVGGRRRSGTISVISANVFSIYGAIFGKVGAIDTVVYWPTRWVSLRRGVYFRIVARLSKFRFLIRRGNSAQLS